MHRYPQWSNCGCWKHTRAWLAESGQAGVVSLKRISLLHSETENTGLHGLLVWPSRAFSYVFKCFVTVTVKQQWQECWFITLPNAVKHSKYVAFENTRMTSFSPRSLDFFLPGSESGNSIQQKIYQRRIGYCLDTSETVARPSQCLRLASLPAAVRILPYCTQEIWLFSELARTLHWWIFSKKGMVLLKFQPFLKIYFTTRNYKKFSEIHDRPGCFWRWCNWLSSGRSDGYNKWSKVLRIVPMQHENKILESCHVSCPEILQPGLDLWTTEEILLSLRQQLRCKKWDMKSDYPELAGPIALVMKLSCLFEYSSS